MADLQVKISASIEGLIKNINTATARLETFSNNAINIGAALTKGLSVPLAAIGTAAFAASVRVGNFSDQILDLEQQTGLTTDAIQKYRAVTIQAGIATDTVATASQNLQRRLASGEEGRKDLTDGLAKLGITARDTAGNLKPIDTIVEQSISRLADFTDITERNQLALKIFGRSAADLAPLLALGSDGIEQAKNRAVELGLVLSKDALEGANEFRIAFDFLKSSIGGITNEIGLAFLPVAQKLVSILQEKIVPVVRSVTGFFNGLSDNTKIVISVIGALVAGIGPLLLSIGVFIKIIPLLTAGLSSIGAAVTFATGPIGIAIALTAALAFGINKLVKEVNLSEKTLSIQKTALNELKKATELAAEAQDLLNKANRDYGIVSEKATLQTKELIKAKIEDVRASIAQAKAVTDLAVAEASKITTLDKLERIFLPGLFSQQKRVNAVQKESAAEIENLNKLLNELTISYFNIGKTVTQVGEATKQTFEEFSKLADIVNAKVFAQFDAEAEEYNKTLQETIDLSRRLASVKFDGLQLTANFDEFGNLIEGTQKKIDLLGQNKIVEVDIQLGGTPPTIEIPQLDESKKTAFLLSLQDFNLQVSEILTSGVQNAIGDFAFSIGEAIGQGGGVIETLGSTLLNSIAQIANQLGQAAIGIGISMIAIKKAFTNPFTAIAAGTALIALAGFISKQVPKITSGIGGGSSVSGVGSSGGSFGSGSVGQGQTFAGSQTSGLFESERFISLALEPVISGDQIRFVLDQSNQRRN